MDFNDTPEQAKFRAKCREWLEANAELKESKSNGHNASSLEDHLKVAKTWQQKKYEAGWAMLHWPTSLILFLLPGFSNFEVVLQRRSAVPIAFTFFELSISL